MKVRATHEIDGIKRKSLNRFHKYLDLEFKTDNRRCFYCNNIIIDKELSVDHVIPWSYMYSDDIWNLVYCHKHENSSKSNNIVLEEVIEKLEKRNKELLNKFEEEIKNKIYDELKLAIVNNYVRKFWITSKG